jgi:hypothetical protein
MTVIQNRLKSLQVSLIEQYYDRKSDMDCTHWTRELEQRREDIRAEVKRGIRTKQGRRSEEDIDSLIDKSWDELLAVIGGRRDAQPGIDEEKLQSILNRVLQAVPAGTAAPGLPSPAAPAFRTQTPEAAQDAAPEEVEELEELAAEPAAEAEDAETVEELEEIPAAEEETAPEEVEELEEPAVLPAVEPEDAEAVEELGEIPAEEKAGAAEEPEEAAEMESAGDSLTAIPAEAEAPEDENQAGALAAAAEKITSAQKRSNVRLAFDGDDIPYIVETSGLELVDEDIDSVLNMMRPDDEPAELEELGELEELEEAEGEAVEDIREPEAADSVPREMSESDIAELASRIEFSPIEETEGAEDAGALGDDLEIVSPFAAMLSNISISDENYPLESEETKNEFAGSLQDDEPEDLDSAESSGEPDPETEKKNRQ